jgi:ribosomal protein S18 acetylase RimI-like enzyme
VPYPIRRIKPTDAEALRELRLHALSSDPGAFGSSYEREFHLPRAEWDRRAAEAAAGDQQCLFVVETPKRLAGMAGAYTLDHRPSLRHLYGMWVAPEARSSGVGEGLVAAIIGWSIEGGADEVQLWVVDDNLVARRLYSRTGFVNAGISQPLPSDPSLTETLMQLSLGSTSSE